jgi:hypothetical protein
MRIAHALRHLAGDQIIERLVGEHAHGGVDERSIDIAAAAGLLAPGQRRKNADRRIDAGEISDTGTPARIGSPSGLPVTPIMPAMPCAIRS